MTGIGFLTRVFQEKDSILDPFDILKQLGAKGITSVLIEGGKKVHESFFNADLMEVSVFEGIPQDFAIFDNLDFFTKFC